MTGGSTAASQAFYRNAYRGSLVSQWLPALDGVVDKLRGRRSAWPTLAAATDIRLCLWPKPFQRRISAASTRIRNRWPRLRKIAAEAGVATGNLRCSAGGRIIREPATT